HRLRPLEENRWRENGEPKEFVGIVRKPPRRGSYGKIKCMTLPEYKGLIDVREEDIEFNLRGTDKVTFQIIFNMKGPQASRVRRLE
ncbi:MAG: hypothetical protein ACOC38_12760, partial [Promethearchaeia archaeon]